MRRTYLLLALLAAGLLIFAGCAGKSSPPQAGTVDESRSGSYASSPTQAPPTRPEGWNYDAMPTPEPSKKPSTRLNEIAFKENEAVIDAEGLAVCREVAKRLIEASQERALVVGFSHYREKDASLALRRAERVRDCLVGQGVPRSRLEVASFGSRFSSPSGGEALERKQPQAVEIWLLSK